MVSCCFVFVPHFSSGLSGVGFFNFTIVKILLRLPTYLIKIKYLCVNFGIYTNLRVFKNNRYGLIDQPVFCWIQHFYIVVIYRNPGRIIDGSAGIQISEFRCNHYFFLFKIEYCKISVTKSFWFISLCNRIRCEAGRNN